MMSGNLGIRNSGSVPDYARNESFDIGDSFHNAIPGIAGLFGGLFGDSGSPYEAASDQYERWEKKAEDAQNPFYNAGVQGMGNYQNWLTGMKDPSKFINNLQSQYQASPYSQYLQKQSMLAGQNAASASGLMGSTPLMQQLQQNSSNIASGDMNQWLQNVLGINNQYGQGQQNLMTGGQNAANALTNLYSNMGQQMGQAAYGREAGQQNDMGNIISGIASIASSFL
jgi:hypothetical protein